VSTRKLYLMVHGTMPPRRSPRRPAGRGPARSWKYKAWIRSLPCAVCDTVRNVEAAHAGEDGGMSQKASDYTCIPLCADHHQHGQDSYHRLGREEFEQRHGLDIHNLVERLNHDWFAYSRLVK
jgi:hypothetical protein